MHAESVQTKSRNSTHVADALFTFPTVSKLVFLRRRKILIIIPNTSSEIDLFEQSHLSNKCSGLFVG